MSSVSQEQVNNEINEIITKNSRPQPILIQTEAFKKSIDIISQFDYSILLNEINNSYSYKICDFCKNSFPIHEGRDYSCKNCKHIFCLKHRDLLHHQCQKINPSYHKYLLAKNLIKNKMKLIKSQGH